jgi:hypothetical protein
MLPHVGVSDFCETKKAYFLGWGIIIFLPHFVYYKMLILYLYIAGNIDIILYSGRSFMRKSKHQKHPNNVIIGGWCGIVVLKAITAVSNFLTTCALVDCS